MRLRAFSFAGLAAAVALVGIAGAQQPPKKKKKKPKTEQPANTDDPDASTGSGDAGLQNDPSSSGSAYQAPPKIDTTLKESDPVNPSTNPWYVSGSAKRRDGSSDPTPASSGSGSRARRQSELESVESRPFSIAAQVGYGSNNLEFGFGARIGYEIAKSFYVGAGFVYHLGESGLISVSAYYPALELGYDWHFEGFTVRPYTGIGMIFFHVSGGSDVITVSSSTINAFTIYPGVQLDYQIPDTPGFVGIDARALLVFGGDTPGGSVGIFGIGGARF